LKGVKFHKAIIHRGVYFGDVGRNFTLGGIHPNGKINQIIDLGEREI